MPHDYNKCSGYVSKTINTWVAVANVLSSVNSIKSFTVIPHTGGVKLESFIANNSQYIKEKPLLPKPESLYTILSP